MRYKIGDRVKIKRGFTWSRIINNALDDLPDRVATVKEIFSGYVEGYQLNEIYWVWTDDEIECLVTEENFGPIKSRWEILDIRED